MVQGQRAYTNRRVVGPRAHLQSTAKISPSQPTKSGVRLQTGYFLHIHRREKGRQAALNRPIPFIPMGRRKQRTKFILPPFFKENKKKEILVKFNFCFRVSRKCNQCSGWPFCLEIENGDILTIQETTGSQGPYPLSIEFVYEDWPDVVEKENGKKILKHRSTNIFPFLLYSNEKISDLCTCHMTLS